VSCIFYYAHTIISLAENKRIILIIIAAINCAFRMTRFFMIKFSAPTDPVQTFWKFWRVYMYRSHTVLLGTIIDFNLLQNKSEICYCRKLAFYSLRSTTSSLSWFFFLVVKKFELTENIINIAILFMIVKMRDVLFGRTVKYSRYILYLFIYFFSFSKKRIHYVDFNKKIKNNKISRIKRPINVVKPILSIG